MAGPWEQYQPAQQQSGPWQQYGGSSAPPAPPTQFGGSFTGQLNPQTNQFEDVSVDQPKQQPAITRFAEGFNKAVTGAATPGEFIDQAKSDWDQFNTGSPSPAPFLGHLVQGIHQGMKDTWARAEQDWKAGNWRSAAGLISKADAVIHAVESGIPVVGSMLSGADQQAGEGNVAGAAGTLTGIAAPMVAGTAGEVQAMNTGEVTNPAPTPSLMSRIPAPVVQNAATVAGAGVGGFAGHFTGLPGASEVGAAGGATLARSLAKKLTSVPEAPEIAPSASLPSGGEPAPASLVMKAMKEGNSPQTSRMLAATAYEDAKKAGTSISREKARAAWLNRQINTPAQAQKAASDLISEIAPKATASKKFEIDFQLHKGNIDAAKKLLDDLLDDKASQQKYQTDLEEEGRAMERYKSRVYRARNSAASNKGSLMSAEQVVDSMPAPYGTMDLNKLLGYEGRRTIEQATEVRNQAMKMSASYPESVKQFIRLYYGEGEQLKPRPAQQ